MHGGQCLLHHSSGASRAAAQQQLLQEENVDELSLSQWEANQ